jgi:hypothetical protein
MNSIVPETEPVVSSDKREWPITEDATVWALEWKQFMESYPELPYDFDAMKQWFEMAIDVGRSHADQRWINDYYRVFGELRELKKQRLPWFIRIFA